MKNDLYWSYNMPLQMFPVYEHDEDDTSPVVDYSVINYMPRKAGCVEVKLSDLLNEQTHEEYCEAAAAHLEHLAKLFREMAKKEVKYIYYPDHGMDKSNLP